MSFSLPRNRVPLALLPFLAVSLWAQQPASPSPESSSKSHSHHSSAQKSGAQKLGLISPGEVEDGVYRNSSLGFTYKLPFGWVDRTSDMRADAQDPSKGMVLLAIFERPPAATGETVNSAVVIAAEDASSYPGLKSAAQYFGPLTELTKAKGFTVVNPPYEFSVGAKLLARGDFSKNLEKAEGKETPAEKSPPQLTMRQSTLVMLAKGYVISFTLIGADEDDVDQLLDNLSFGGSKATAAHP